MHASKVTIYSVTGITILISSAQADTPAPVIADVKEAYSVLKNDDFKVFFDKWCHPHVKKQFSSYDHFLAFMKGKDGEKLKGLYSSVIALHSAQSPKIKFGPRRSDGYQYKLLYDDDMAQGKHEHNTPSYVDLELKLGEDRRWKLFDVD